MAICFPGTSDGDAGCWFCQFGLTRDYPPSAFLKDLGEAGFVEGRDVAIEYRWAKGDMSACLRSSIILVQRKASVIVETSASAVMAARAANVAVPTVFTTSGDPIRLALVSNDKPNGNLTGTGQFDAETASKRLELIREIFPSATNVGLLVNPPSPLASPVSREISEAAAALGRNLKVVRARMRWIWQRPLSRLRK